MNPSKDAIAYWRAINSSLTSVNPRATELWREEKIVNMKVISLLKEEALTYLSGERTRIMRLSKNAAINEILKFNRVDSRISTISNYAVSSIFDVGVE